MSELREKVAMNVLRAVTGRGDAWAAADRILALPEIAEALEMRRDVKTGLRRYGEVVFTGVRDEPTAPDSPPGR